MTAMDSYDKFSLKIPRYVIALCAERLSVEDVSLLQKVATSLYATHKPSLGRIPSDNGASGSGTSSNAGAEQFQQQNVWINVVAPEYGAAAQGAEASESLFTSGWRRVLCREADGEGGVDGGSVDANKTTNGDCRGHGDGHTAFSVMRQIFVKERSAIPVVPVSKLRAFTGMVASELDKLADKLPTGGFLMDVVWLMPTSTEFPILERADAFLFSVLRRLEVWHNARVTIILGSGVEGENHPSLTHWKEYIGCQVVPMRPPGGEIIDPREILSSSASLAWQGEVKYISSRGTVFPPWPGFSLHRLKEDGHRSEPFIEILPPSTDPGEDGASLQSTEESDCPSLSNLLPRYVVSKTLEFIHLANLHEIPSWFILPGKFELRLKDKERHHRYSRSRFWMRYLTHRLPGDGQGAICQLSCLELDGPMPTACSQGLSTEVWTSGITADPFNPTVPNVQLKGTKHTFFFLVHGDRRGRCIALPLVSPFMLNGAAHALLASHEAQEGTTVASRPASDVLNGVPTLNGRQLREDEEELARMQVKALAMVIEKIRAEGLEMNVTPSLLLFLFNYMRKVYYEGHGFEVASPSPGGGRATSTVGEQSSLSALDSAGVLPACSGGEQSEGGQNEGRDEQGVEREMEEESSAVPAVDPREIPTELDQSPSEWVERQALQNRESITNRLRRLQSSDMMLAGFSVPPPDSNTITLSAKEFLRHFKPNGQPKRDDLVLGPCPVARQSPRTRAATASFHPGGPSANELMKTGFDDALKLRCHGINYCQDALDSQTADQRMVRLQQRCVRHEMASTFASHHEPKLAIRTKRRRSNSTSDQKNKIRKISASSARKKCHRSTGQLTPSKRPLLRRTSTTPLKGMRVTPSTSTTHGTQKKRARRSVTGGLTPKRLKKSTPQKARAKEMMSPRRSARNSVTEQQEPLASSNKLVSPSSASRVPASSSASSTSAAGKMVGGSTDSASKSGRSTTRKSSSASESRSEKHKRKLRSIVEETLKARGVNSSHGCFKQCVTRLYTQTKMFVKDLKTSKGLYDEMRKIAEANVDFVISFELKRVAPKATT